MALDARPASPRWGAGIKLVVSLVLAAVLLALVVRFRSIIGPLLLVGIVSYLVHPLAGWVRRRTRLPWAGAVSLIYLALVLVLGGLLTWGGVALAPQVVSLFDLISGFLNDLPGTLAKLTSTTLQVGSLRIDLAQYGLSALADQLLGVVRPLLGQIGSILGRFAGGAAGVFGWLFFILLVSYFLLVESGGAPERYFTFQVPGYGEDFRRLAGELGRIWNAFLRGQFLVILIAIAVYSLLLSLLGVRYAVGLALLAGIARFVPYVGAWVTWITLGLVSFFQPSHPYGLNAPLYTGLVLGLALLTDTLLDNMVSTRILARALRIHPAAVLIAAIVLANLIGLVGVVLASPMVATLQLFLRYVTRKLFDQDPWAGLEERPAPPPQGYLRHALQRMAAWLSARFRRAK